MHLGPASGSDGWPRRREDRNEVEKTYKHCFVVRTRFCRREERGLKYDFSFHTSQPYTSVTSGPFRLMTKSGSLKYEDIAVHYRFLKVL